MIALVDIGNSRTKYAFHLDGELSESKALANERLTLQWLQQTFVGVTRVIIANVSSNSLNELVKGWARSNQVNCQIVCSEKTNFGVTSAYEQPKQLGVDRWLAMLGARKMYPDQNVLIVDAGTATTIELLAGSGQHLGGWILPGLTTMFDSVLTQTSRVAANKLLTPSLAFGKNTSENVNNACWAATVGAVEVAIRQAEQLITTLDVILLTGGNEKSLSSLLNKPVVSVNNLIFIGLESYIAE